VIGLQYGFTSMFFLVVGLVLVMLMRWQLAYPGTPVPLLGALLGEANAPGGVILPEFYNQLGAMHGTIMVFLGVVPLAFGAFGNYVLPLQIGAPDMSFPRLNMLSYWLFFAGGVVMLFSFTVPGIVQPVWFTPTVTGQWDIACSQLCGLGHYRLRGVYQIQAQADYQA
jgi:cytochrome c oxidase subunit 1